MTGVSPTGSSEKAPSANPLPNGCQQPWCRAVATQAFDGDTGLTYRGCDAHHWPMLFGLLKYRLIKSATNFRGVSGG